MEPISQSRYVVKSIVHAAEILSAFQSEGEVLRLRANGRHGERISHMQDVEARRLPLTFGGNRWNVKCPRAEEPTKRCKYEAFWRV